MLVFHRRIRWHFPANKKLLDAATSYRRPLCATPQLSRSRPVVVSDFIYLSVTFEGRDTSGEDFLSLRSIGIQSLPRKATCAGVRQYIYFISRCSFSMTETLFWPGVDLNLTVEAEFSTNVLKLKTSSFSLKINMS